jgi:transposase
MPKVHKKDSSKPVGQNGSGRLSLAERRHIIKLRRDKLTYTMIHRLTGYGLWAIRHWGGMANQKNPNLSDQPRSGRPSKFSAQQRRTVVRAGANKRRPGSVAKSLTRRGGMTISTSTVRRIWARAKTPYRRCKITPQRHLSDINKRKRMDFSMTRAPTATHPWAFLDGKVCTLYENGVGQPGYEWRRIDQGTSVAPGKLIARFFVYAMVGHDLKSQLIFTAPSPKKGSGEATGGRAFNSSDYIQLMRTFSKVLHAWRPGGQYYIIRDRASQHTSAASEEALAPLNLPILDDFPPCSWDINCIEHVWAQLINLLEGRRPTTADGFRRVILESWDAISQDTINKIVAKVPERLRKIVELEGEWISSYKSFFSV